MSMQIPTLAPLTRTCFTCRVPTPDCDLDERKLCKYCAAKEDRQKRDKARAASRKWKREHRRQVNAYQRRRYRLNKLSELRVRLFG